MKSRFKRADFKDSDTNVELSKTREEKKQQEKLDAVKVSLYDLLAWTHIIHLWPTKMDSNIYNAVLQLKILIYWELRSYSSFELSPLSHN